MNITGSRLSGKHNETESLYVIDSCLTSMLKRGLTVNVLTRREVSLIQLLGLCKEAPLYKAAEEQISKGLSPFSRFILGFFSTLFGVVMVLIAPPTDKAVFFYAFGIFCLLISAACVTKGRVRQFVGSVIGSILLLLSGWYLYSEITDGPLFTGRRSEPSVVNALFFLVAFGIPGVAYAIKTKFGWRRNETKTEP